MHPQVFATLALHAKLHQRLDVLTREQKILQEIERREILAYDNDARFAKLEELKSELLRIAFVKKN